MDNEINDRSINPLIRIADSLEEIIKMIKQEQEEVKKYTSYSINTKFSNIDSGVLIHQIPGGMISNLTSQLNENNNLNKRQKTNNDNDKNDDNKIMLQNIQIGVELFQTFLVCQKSDFVCIS